MINTQDISSVKPSTVINSIDEFESKEDESKEQDIYDSTNDIVKQILKKLGKYTFKAPPSDDLE